PQAARGRLPRDRLGETDRGHPFWSRSGRASERADQPDAKGEEGTGRVNGAVDARGRCSNQDERIRGRQARRRHDSPRHLPLAARARKWRLGGTSDVRRPRLTATQHRTVVEAGPAPAPAGGRLVAAAAFALPPVMLLVVAFGLGVRGGGVAPEQWQPVAVGLAAGLLVLAVVGAVPRVPRAALPM